MAEQKQQENVSTTIRRPIIGILGGVGPMAGVLLQTKIINKTVVATDQEHLDVVHLSLSQYVGDRTGFLLQNKDAKEIKGDNPGIGMGKVARALSQAAQAMQTSAAVGVSCNTFHAPLIFDAFTAEVAKVNEEVMAQQQMKGDMSIEACVPGYLHVFHMVELTLAYIERELGVDKVGLMSTTGTRETGLYSDIAANKFKMQILEVEQKDQEELHDSIYNQKDGIKKLSAASPRVRANFEKYVKSLHEMGATAAILGCTEIPIVLPEKELYGVKLIDPMDVLADALIGAAQQSVAL